MHQEHAPGILQLRISANGIVALRRLWTKPGINGLNPAFATGDLSIKEVAYRRRLKDPSNISRALPKVARHHSKGIS